MPNSLTEFTPQGGFLFKPKLPMKTVSVSIRGTTPLMLCRFPESREVPSSTRQVLVDHGTPREQAEVACYRDRDGRFYFPGTAIGKMLREAGANHKLKGSRRSARYVIPAAILIEEDCILIRNGDGNSLSKDFEVDSRPVVIPATKGRIMCHRPCWDYWSAQFSIKINDELLPVEFINKLMTEASQQIGIGAFRPERGGPFGTFLIYEWKELNLPQHTKAIAEQSTAKQSEP